MDWIFLSELAINGALTGLLYSLFAIGLVLIYKASSVPNLAQGGLTMVGAYVVLALSNDAGLPLWLAIPFAALIMFGLGFGIERVALRRLAGRPIHRGGHKHRKHPAAKPTLGGARHINRALSSGGKLRGRCNPASPIELEQYIIMAVKHGRSSSSRQ